MEQKIFLSIVIPSYNETPLMIYPLLASIACQTGVNFNAVEVIIMKDGGGGQPYSAEFLKLFPIQIKEYALPENVGPGMVREAGLELATGEYVMFCDADDSLYTTVALQALISTAEADTPDILRSEWFEESVLNDGTVKYIHKVGENTWLHGKLFRRQFLIDKQIHFHPELRVHEDTYFLSIAAASTGKYLSIPVPTYLWRHNANSITRGNDHEYQYSSFPEFFKASGLSHDIVERVNPDIMEYKVIQVACYCYFAIHDDKWLRPEVKQYRDAVEANFKKYHGPTWKYFLNAPRERVMQIYNEERAKHFGGGIEIETFGAWLTRIGLGVPAWLYKGKKRR